MSPTFIKPSHPPIVPSSAVLKEIHCIPLEMKATEALLKDHLLINKILEQFSLDHPRFEHISLTLHRALKGHAWFEDEIFLPAIKAEPLIFGRFTDEIYQEHKDMDALLK